MTPTDPTTNPAPSSLTVESVDVDAMPTPEPSNDPAASEPAPSYVKLAMRNMVRKGGKSLFHFFLTASGLIGLFIGLAYLTR